MFCRIDFFLLNFIRLFSNRKMSIINRQISTKFQNIWRNSICYKALCLPESESAKLVMVVMVMIFIVVMLVMVIMVIRINRKPGQPGQKGQTGQTDLTFKLDFSGNLCRAAFTLEPKSYSQYCWSSSEMASIWSLYSPHFQGKIVNDIYRIYPIIALHPNFKQVAQHLS